MTTLIHPLIFQTDSYKLSHFKQYPPGTEAIHSYIEARSKDPNHNSTVFFGLQAILATLLTAWAQTTIGDIEIAAGMFEKHGVPFNKEGWIKLKSRYDESLPLHIRAVPEGTIVPNGNVLATIETTDPDFPWLGGYLETALLRVWYPTSVASNSHRCKQVIKRYLEATADDLSGLPFKLHDFGARGVSSGESAMLGGMGHLVNFFGTDTLEALVGANWFYDEDVAGFSIPAAEHSTITSWGRENEGAAFKNMLDQFAKPGSLLAVVSDSYDIYAACRDLWGGELRQQVIDSGATLVVRPDSGDPTLVLPTILEILAGKFGFTTNSKGYSVLKHVRVIQGDGISGPDDIKHILSMLKESGWSADNIAFGMGGGLLQQVNRDTYGFAMKASAIKIDGEWRDVFKDPITQPGKSSKKGRLTLVRDGDAYSTVPARGAVAAAGWGDKRIEVLQDVYVDGRFVKPQSLKEIRGRVGTWQ